VERLSRGARAGRSTGVEGSRGEVAKIHRCLDPAGDRQDHCIPQKAPCRTCNLPCARRWRTELEGRLVRYGLRASGTRADNIARFPRRRQRTSAEKFAPTSHSLWRDNPDPPRRQRGGQFVLAVLPCQCRHGGVIVGHVAEGDAPAAVSQFQDRIAGVRGTGLDDMRIGNVCRDSRASRRCRD
jgi:hypothetical protein